MASRIERQPLLGRRETPKTGICALLSRLISAVSKAFKKYFSCFTTTSKQAKSLNTRDICLMNVTKDGFLVPKNQAPRKESQYKTVMEALQARSRFEKETFDDLLLADERVELEESIVEPIDLVDENTPMAFSADGTLKPVRNLKQAANPFEGDEELLIVSDNDESPFEEMAKTACRTLTFTDFLMIRNDL